MKTTCYQPKLEALELRNLLSSYIIRDFGSNNAYAADLAGRGQAGPTHHSPPKLFATA
jgi:hypothetical protein